MLFFMVCSLGSLFSFCFIDVVVFLVFELSEFQVMPKLSRAGRLQVPGYPEPNI